MTEIINSQIQSVTRRFSKEKTTKNQFSKTTALKEYFSPVDYRTIEVLSKTGTIGLNSELTFELTAPFPNSLINAVYLYVETTNFSGTDGQFKSELLGAASCIERLTFEQSGNPLLIVERDSWEFALSSLNEDRKQKNALMVGSSPDTQNTNGLTPIPCFWNGMNSEDLKHTLVVPLLKGKNIVVKMRLVSDLAKIGNTTGGTVSLPTVIKLMVSHTTPHRNFMAEVVKSTNVANLVNSFQVEKSAQFTGTGATQLTNQILTSIKGNVKVLSQTVHNVTDYPNEIAVSPYTGKLDTTLLISNYQLKNAGSPLREYSQRGTQSLMMSDALLYHVGKFPAHSLNMQFCQLPWYEIGTASGFLGREQFLALRSYITGTFTNAKVFEIVTVAVQEVYFVYSRKTGVVNIEY